MLSYPQQVWLAPVVVLLAVLTLLRLRREVALRLANLRWPVLAALAVRTVLFACGWRSESVDFVAWPVSILLLAGLQTSRDVWLVRTTSADLQRELGDACGKLRLTCEESSPGEFRLTQPGQTYVLTVRPLLNRLQSVRVPQQPTGKAALLLLWMRKRYHSVAPRLRVVLSSSAE